MIPYAKHELTAESIDLVSEVLAGGHIARGPTTSKFEELVRERFSYQLAIACSSGSTALEIVLRSLKLSIEDEVIVPSITWVATASSVVLAGAKPVFADIDSATYCISANTIQPHINSRTKAIIVVHFAGLACDMQSIWQLAKNHGLQVIEDAAHAFGSKYLNSESYVGSSPNSYASIFSFHPAKNITTGEGGMVVSAHSSLYDKLLLYKNGGVVRSSDHLLKKANYAVQAISSNYHMSDILAAIGIGQLSSLNTFIDHRQHIARCYSNALADIPEISLPLIDQSSSCNLYIIRVNDYQFRDSLVIHLHDNGIGVYFHYPPLHQFESVYGTSEPLPNAEQYALSALTLPMGTHVSPIIVNMVSDLIRIFFC